MVYRFSRHIRGVQESLADFFLLFQASGQKPEGGWLTVERNNLLFFLALKQKMATDGGGVPVAENKGRVQEV